MSYPPVLTILVIDDCAQERELYCGFLKQDSRQNYHILEFETTATAWKWCQQEIPDIILLDFAHGDGLKFIQQFRECDRNTQTPVIMLCEDQVTAIRAMNNGVQDYLVKEQLTEQVLQSAIHHAVERMYLIRELEQSRKQHKLISAIALRIRQSVELEEILRATASEVREFLQADRVLVYQFQPNMSGTIVAESVISNWTVALGKEIPDTYFQQGAGSDYGQGKKTAIEDIYQAGLSNCHLHLLEQFEVKANLVVPILVTDKLWGLLIAHQCSSSRHWQSAELDLLDQLAVQIAIAIQQGLVYQQVQAELRNSDRHYATLTAAVAIFRLDATGQCIYVNDGWSDMTGRPIESALGMGWIEAVHPEDRDRLGREWSLKFQEGHINPKGFYKSEGKHLRPDGSINWFSVQVLPEISTHDTIIGYVGTLTDISERKQAEEQLRHTNEQLARATRLKNEFLANMSHELRTPLNAILGMSEALQESVFGSINDRQVKAIATIERSGRHLLELINDILDLSKIESGKLELQLSDVFVSSLCATSMAFVKQMALKKHIHLTTHIAENIHSIKVDDRCLRQVLINLLSNAVKFTPEGGSVTLEVSRGNPGVYPEFFPNICFCVTDTGIGIAPEDISKLFQPFVQLDSSLNRQYSGTGLGLALVDRIVTLHGGTVSVSSQVGVGSCFNVTIPYHTSNNLPKANLKPALILLVEDDQANIDPISGYLESSGYDLILANSGQKAIDLVRSHSPDLILMDIQMPGMDGLEAMRHIREDRQFVNIPMIALTALAMPSDRETCLAAGANEYLSKPVKLKQLALTIQQLLAK